MTQHHAGFCSLSTTTSVSASASSLSSLYLFDGGLHTKAEPVKWEAQQDE